MLSSPEANYGTEPQSQQHVAHITPHIVKGTELERWTSAHEVVVAGILITTPMENLYLVLL